MKHLIAALTTIAIAAFALITALPAHAALIVIEPDDFVVGEPVTSDYAIVSQLINGVSAPVYTTTNIPGGYAAPTGSAVFSRMPGGTPGFVASSYRGNFLTGLQFEFLTPVESVTVDFMNFMYNAGIKIDCYAWTVGGDGPTVCSGFHSSTPRLNVGEYGEATLRAFNGQQITRILLGGEDTLPFIAFDRVKFEVPEPATFGLFSLALCGLLVRRRRVQ